MISVLLIEDDKDLLSALSESLADHGFEIFQATDPEKAILSMSQHKPQMVVCDVHLNSSMDGLSLNRFIAKKYPDIPVILMTAMGNVSEAVLALREGAIDYLVKPFSSKELIEKIHPLIVSDATIIAEDPYSKNLLEIAKKVAQSDASVLITGPSGTGKEKLAQFIHQQSDRKDKPFVAINCAAIPENMLEATLFGYEKGAFTGAVAAHEGKFEQAQQGTLLLDEISEMPINLQAKLLRVLQENEVERLGSKKTIYLNVRIIATSNRDLMKACEEGDFRSDLYYRLNVMPLSWVELRRRPKDILPVAEYILKKQSLQMKKTPPKLSESAIKKLKDYPWPGNVRELYNVMQRSLILAKSEVIEDINIQFHSDFLQVSTETSDEC